jgi:serine protease Do
MKSSRFNWVMVALIIALAVGVGTDRLALSQKSAELDNAIAEISTLQSETASLADENANLRSELSSGTDQTNVLSKRIEALETQLPTIGDSVNKVMPSVVFIRAEFEDEASGQAFELRGSGFILRPDGYIFTNRHVVEDASSIEVMTEDRQLYEPTDIWLDDVLDLAVVKIEAQNLPTAQFGDPDSIKLADWAIALGFPLGYSPVEGGATVTLGIISALDRSFYIGSTPYFDVIQTDAAVNPGNSGGPLINLAGEVIGINSAGASQAQNINFAINAATARHVFEDLVNFGRVEHPFLGATLEDITPSMACEICLEQRLGVLLIDVEPGGPAELAGLEKGDVITRFDAQEIFSVATLIRVLWRHQVGDMIPVTFWRDGTILETTVILGQRPRAGAV